VQCACSESSQTDNQDRERNTLVASALATFFRHIGYVNKNSSAQEKCPTFVAKERKSGFFPITKLKQKVKYVFDSKVLRDFS